MNNQVVEVRIPVAEAVAFRNEELQRLAGGYFPKSLIDYQAERQLPAEKKEVNEGRKN